MSRLRFFGILLITSLFSGCVQKVQVKTLEPAEIDSATTTKIIAVLPFKNDHTFLANKIKTTLTKQRVDEKPYFTLVNYSDKKALLSKHDLQNSGLIDPSTAVKVGNILGAQAIISGSLTPTTIRDEHYYKMRSKCKDGKCWEVKVSCKQRTIGLSVEIRMINVSTAKIIYADTIRRQQQWSRCADDQKTLPSKEAGAQYLANSIASNFVYKLTPHYRLKK